MKLNCYVFVGFAERATDEIYYNSLLIVNPAGQIHTIYRKHFLYSTDESWATEGDGFMVVDLSFNEGKNVVRVAPAICMDLNPKKFEARFEDYELATFAVENNVDAVIAIMAWLDSSSKDSDGEEDANEPGSDWRDAQEYIGYWVHRLTPLLTKSGAPGSKDVIFIACNRVGTEGGMFLSKHSLTLAEIYRLSDSTFCGTSAFVQLSHTPVVLAHAKRKGEEVLRAEIEI
jgi:protein N-terminal amidase